MRDYIVTVDESEDELTHYGVLGMKWHHHQAVKYSSKAARASNAARDEQKYRKDFDKDMKRRMNKNDPNDVRTWQNTRNAEHEASKFNEQSYRDRAKKYYKKANEHLDKNRRAQEEYRNSNSSSAKRKFNKSVPYASVTDQQMAKYERNKRGHAALLGTVGVAVGISAMNAKRQRKKGGR